MVDLCDNYKVRLESTERELRVVRLHLRDMYDHKLKGVKVHYPIMSMVLGPMVQLERWCSIKWFDLMRKRIIAKWKLFL